MASGVVPRAGRGLAEARVRRTCRREGLLSLTYDDGPGLRVTPQVLDLLAEHDARATFFVLGHRVPTTTALLDRMVAEGHEVGCHGQDHLHYLRVPRRAALEDISRGYGALAPWVPPQGIFRPPHGSRSLATQRALRRRGAPTAWWTVDSGDTWQEPRSTDEVLDDVRRAGGGIVLMHDFDRHGEHESREPFVLSLTARLLDMAHRRGWRVTPAGTLA